MLPCRQVESHLAQACFCLKSCWLQLLLYPVQTLKPIVPIAIKLCPPNATIRTRCGIPICWRFRHKPIHARAYGRCVHLTSSKCTTESIILALIHLRYSCNHLVVPLIVPRVPLEKVRGMYCISRLRIFGALPRC